MSTILTKTHQILCKTFPFLRVLSQKLRGHNPNRRIRGENNTVHSGDADLSSVVFDIKGNHNTVELGEGCTLNHVTIYMRGDHHHLQIGKNVRFHHGGHIWFEDREGRLSIGDKTSFEDVHLAITEPGSKITIGEKCLFAYDIDVRTGDSHSILNAKTGERLNYAQDVAIGDHVWVAAHSLIMKGVRIQQGSVVAGGAVVTKPFEQKGIVIGGNPAKQIKENIAWSGKRLYKDS